MSDENNQLDRIEQDVRAMHTLLTGNGTPSKGLIVRVDRIEQKAACMSRALWAVSATFLAAITTSIVTLITRSN